MDTGGSALSRNCCSGLLCQLPIPGCCQIDGSWKTFPLLKPCNASSIKSAGMPKRLCSITHFWMTLACSGVG